MEDYSSGAAEAELGELIPPPPVLTPVDALSSTVDHGSSPSMSSSGTPGGRPGRRTSLAGSLMNRVSGRRGSSVPAPVPVPGPSSASPPVSGRRGSILSGLSGFSGKGRRGSVMSAIGGAIRRGSVMGSPGSDATQIPNPRRGSILSLPKGFGVGRGRPSVLVEHAVAETA